jgi:hypothetical protein
MKKIIRLTESELIDVVKQIVEQTNIPFFPTFSNKLAFKNSHKKPKLKFKTKKSLLELYLGRRPELIPIYKDIEKQLGDKFTKDHFTKEINYSGGLKNLSNGISPNVKNAFDKMLAKYGLTGKIKIDPNSFRTFQKQKETFIKMAKKHGGKISDGLRQAALPGFSQHHTGKALDVSPSKLLTDEMLHSFGFKRPYNTDTGFRMTEPWHIIYTK